MQKPCTKFLSFVNILSSFSRALSKQFLTTMIHYLQYMHLVTALLENCIKEWLNRSPNNLASLQPFLVLMSYKYEML